MAWQPEDFSASASSVGNLTACPGWCLGSPVLGRAVPWHVGAPRLRVPPGARQGHWGEIILCPCGLSIDILLAKVLCAMNCQEVNLSAWRAGAARARCQGVQSRDFCGLGVHKSSAAATKPCWAVQWGSSNACSGMLYRSSACGWSLGRDGAAGSAGGAFKVAARDGSILTGIPPYLQVPKCLHKFSPWLNLRHKNSVGCLLCDCFTPSLH